MRSRDLAAFIKERENVRVNKERGLPRPWTKDPILDKYRFCNVHREHDKVTRWLRDNWYSAFSGDPDIWFTAVVARLLNLPESLTDVIEYTLPWKPVPFRAMLHGRKVQKLNNFNAAYIVSTNGVAMDKIEYITSFILNALWKDRERLRPSINDNLSDYHTLLTSYNGLGSFIAAQVVADLKYIEPLKHTGDWWTFASSGPGSRRGLNRVMGVSPQQSMTERGFRWDLEHLAAAPEIKKLNLHAQDLQNCLCEFDKYERARLGEGTPKQIYKERNDG